MRLDKALGYGFNSRRLHVTSQNLTAFVLLRNTGQFDIVILIRDREILNEVTMSYEALCEVRLRMAACHLK